jgi:hypothetical protein
MMRAIVQRAYGAADVLRLQDIAAPELVAVDPGLASAFHVGVVAAVWAAVGWVGDVLG